MWLFAVFVVVPLIEIALFIKIGGWLTLWPTLAIVVGSAMLGTTLVRHQGAQAMADLRRAMADLSDPSAPLAHGAMILLAGALLITPGFLTDSIGLLLLVPAVRTALMHWAGRRIRVERVVMGGRQSTSPGADWHRDEDGPVIDADFEEIDQTNRSTHPPSGWTRH